MADAVNPEDQFEWYVVNSYAGQEKRVETNIINRMKSMGVEDCLVETWVPEEKEVVMKDGKPVMKDGKPVIKTHYLFSGYILVKMRMTNQAWYVVRNTPGVTGFIGSSGKGAKPFPVSEEEIARLRRDSRLQDESPEDENLENEEADDVNIVVDYGPGDIVKILSGVYEGNEVPVLSMDDKQKEATVNIFTLGRENPTPIPYRDLKKVS